MKKFTEKNNKGQIFYWININDLQNYKLLPDSTYELIKDSENIKHIIEKQKKITNHLTLIYTI